MTSSNPFSGLSGAGIASSSESETTDSRLSYSASVSSSGSETEWECSDIIPPTPEKQRKFDFPPLSGQSRQGQASTSVEPEVIQVMKSLFNTDILKI